MDTFNGVHAAPRLGKAVGESGSEIRALIEKLRKIADDRRRRKLEEELESLEEQGLLIRLQFLHIQAGDREVYDLAADGS